MASKSGPSWPNWMRDIRPWQLLVASLALFATITIGLERHWESKQRAVSIRSQMFVNPESGYMEGVSWPVYIAVTNDGPAEGKNFSAYFHIVNLPGIGHAPPTVIDKPAGTMVEVSTHGHGDEYILNIKNLVATTSVTIEIIFRAENDAMKQELLNKYRDNPFSGMFIAEFVKELSFSGDNVLSEISVGTLPSVPEWNGFEVLRKGNLSRQHP